MATFMGSGSPWLKVAALSGASAVALGAYGAHALRPTGPDADYYLSTFDRASRYHLTHSLLIAAAPLARRPSLVGGLATLGIVLFSGRCLAEVIGTAFAIWLGQSNVANELLAHTKGHGMGFGWLSFGYGLAFGVGILLTGWISAYFNPALALAAWINHNSITSASEYFAIASSTICGAFIGGLMVFLQFWPHFQIVPKPPQEFGSISGRFRPQGLAEDFSSEHDPMEQPTYNDNTGRTITCIPYVAPLKIMPKALYAVLGGSYEDLPAADGGDATAPRHDPRHFALPRVSPAPSAPEEVAKASSGTQRRAVTGRPGPASDPAIKGSKLPEKAQQGHNLPKLLRALRPLLRPFQRAHHHMEARMHETKLKGILRMPTDDGAVPVQVSAKVLARMEEGGNPAERAMAAKYAKGIKADQVAKLLCFCTRPAIYSPLLNWLCEFISTIALITAVYVFQEQLARVYPNTTVQYNMISATFVAALIILLVLGLGGPTGVAMSPARDMGPRLAHWVLPIRGKGSSEFLSYSWIPLTASMTAAVPSAFIVRGINHLIATGMAAPGTETVGSG